MKMFNEKVAIVTGGASGIGLATVKKLLGENAFVAMADLSDNVFSLANSLGDKCIGIKCLCTSKVYLYKVLST